MGVRRYIIRILAYDFLKEFFVINNEELKPLYRFQEIFSNVRSQYFYYSHRFKGAAVFMQVGRFYEFYSANSPVPDMLKLKPFKPNKRRAKYGFPVYMGNGYAKKAATQGIPVVFVMETDRYIGRIKSRLPRMKMTAVQAR